MSNPAPTPAGWYPDPWDPRAQRYWDGAQWTQHTAPAAAQQPAPQQPAAPQQTGYGYGYAAPGTAAGSAYATYGARPQRARVADETPVYGPFIWVVALLPLVGAIMIWFIHIDVHPLVEFARQMQAYDDAGGVGPLPELHIGQIFGAGYWVAILLSPLVWVAGVVFSYLDWARLNSVGVERPFHWAWAFLTPLVYVIGRSVIVRRVAAPRGLVPIWVLLAVYAVGIVSSSIWSAIFSSDLMSRLNTIVSNT